jgi:hypothetical protein
LGGDGSVDSLAEWLDCVAAASECAVDTALAVTYPRGLEWLALVRPAMLPIDQDGAVAALDAVFAALDGTPAGDLTPDIRCGPADADMAAMFPATGQTSCWDSSGTPIGCTGTGHDGDIQAGAPLSYTDNGDGTITDNNTGLMWEKLCNGPPDTTCPAVHDVDTTYTWADMFAVKIAALNTPPCFAGYCDWRAPNVKELPSIVNYENVSPAVSPAFNDSCVAPCSVTTCSCTAASLYWSSTSNANGLPVAWFVGFDDGFVGLVGKSFPLHVRAVRGGQ